MKTIFISILSGVEAKDILRTNIVQRLLDAGVRVVLFLKSYERAEIYKKEFLHPNLVYEVASDFKLSEGDKIFEFLKNYLVRTKSLFIYKKASFIKNRNYLAYALSIFLSLILGWSIFRKIARVLDQKFVKNRAFNKFFEKYNPDLVFLANLFDAMEIAMLRDAKARGVKTVGFVNSWDKITIKGHMRILPDKLIVPNEIVKKEAQKYLGEKEKNIFVSGIPQYDHYINEPVVSREEFFKKINADPQKELLVFAPLGSAFSDSDWDMIDLMHELVQKDAFVKKTELLVRFPPNDFAHMEEIRKRPYLRCDVPGTRFGTKIGMDWDMDFNDLSHLRNTLRHCSLVIGYASSLMVDAAFCGKPAMTIGFTLRPPTLGEKDPRMWYHTTHYSKAIATGGIRWVKSKEEMIKWINNYLENPGDDAEERKRLIREQCYKTDGKTGERIANFLLTTLNTRAEL